MFDLRRRCGRFGVVGYNLVTAIGVINGVLEFGRTSVGGVWRRFYEFGFFLLLRWFRNEGRVEEWGQKVANRGRNFFVEFFWLVTTLIVGGFFGDEILLVIRRD